MGEWSKTVGEKGEKIVEYFLKEILGYDNVESNASIDCIKGAKHKVKTSKGNKTTHGIDAMVSVKSPLEDGLLDIAIVSSKFSSKDYPNSPKTIFKEYVEDLAYTIECYKNSKLYSETNQKFGNVSRTEIIGILIWASNKSPESETIIPKIANTMIDSKIVFDKIIVVDNEKLSFFADTIQSAKKEFGSKNVKFIYHNTSLNNLSLQSVSYGDFLPMQYIFSDVLPIRVLDGGEVQLIIFSKDNFSKDNFSRFLDFAKSFDHLDTASKTILSFPDYNELEHKSLIVSELFKFTGYKFQENLFVKKHKSDFKNY